MALFNAKSSWNTARDQRSDESSRQKLAAAWRKATADQILTPAPDQAALSWKRSAVRRRCLPITKEAAEAAICADEAFLAAYPVTRAKSRRLCLP
ncbi:hypothetical protein B6S44_23150 [Bosea sp. Tri-44]|nr:hypothetical protein B6S44_23150 [Bosea sp. Tri-44]